MSRSIQHIGFLLLLLVSSGLHGQFLSAGISPSLSMANYRGLTTVQRAELPDPFYPGINIEGNYILQGFPFPISGYNSFGLGLYAVGQDSVDLADGNGTSFIRNLHVRDWQVRFGYELAPENEFLTFYLGWSMGIRSLRSKVTSAWNSQGPISTDQLDVPKSNRTFTIGILASGMYEFEHFFVFARYEFILSPAEAQLGANSWHQFHIGILRPIYRF